MFTDPRRRARWAYQLGFTCSANLPWNGTSRLVPGAVPARALHELHPHPGPGELLDQQRLVGELAGEAVRE